MDPSNNPDDSTSLSGNGISAIHEDAQGALWGGTRGGLNRMDPSTASFERFTHDPTDPTTLSSDVTIAIHEDAKGVLWVSTRGGWCNG